MEAKLIKFLIIFIMILFHTSADNINIFLLGGQSNMVGRGSLEVPCPECRPNKNIIRFTVNRTWEGAHDPLHRDIDMLSRAAAAVHTGGVIRALLWYQGEADSKDADNVRLYKTRFRKFIDDFRRDLEFPTLPVVEVALDNVYNDSSYLEEVRKAQLDTAVELQNVRCVDAAGLPLQPPDFAHLTTTSQVIVGDKMAEAFLQLIGGAN